MADPYVDKKDDGGVNVHAAYDTNNAEKGYNGHHVVTSPEEDRLHLQLNGELISTMLY